MGRMTKRAEGTVVYAGGYKQYEGGDIPAEVSPQGVRELLVRLAEYEDTGLTPGEIKSMQEEHFSGLEMAKLHSALMELKKYQEADKDGRIVVLPCKVGGKLWVIGRDNVPREMALEAPGIRTVCTDEDNLCMSTCNRKPDGFCAYRLRNDGTSIGKTVFLTREEAEKALEAMKDG
jgi:hypothetical protein